MTITMATKSARLEQHAKDAIAQYNKDVAGGGEPVFPDWALDLLMVLDRCDKLAAALKTWHKFAIDNKWDDENCTFLPDTRAALASVGAA